MPSAKVGRRAPDFELEGTDGPFKLSDHLGERVVLLFYPGDNTPVCTKQFCSYAERADDMRDLPATVVGISSQDLVSHQDFHDKHSIPVPLLADTDKSVAKAYGVLGPGGAFVRRAIFVIDPEGVIRYRKVALVGLGFEDADDLHAALDRARTAA